MGRENTPIEGAKADQQAGTAKVVVRVVERPQEPAADISDAQAVPDADVKISDDGGFQGDQLTNERGSAEFAAVPTGKLYIDVRRNGDRLQVTFQVTEDPAQEIWITLPPQTAAAQASKKSPASLRR
jgi:hypothetical protein